MIAGGCAFPVHHWIFDEQRSARAIALDVKALAAVNDDSRRA
jgi:hypothetical protein